MIGTESDRFLRVLMTQKYYFYSYCFILILRANKSKSKSLINYFLLLLNECFHRFNVVHTLKGATQYEVFFLCKVQTV